jgi:hypothetical protein
MATKLTFRTGDHSRTFHYKSVTYEPLADSLFELPPAVKALLKRWAGSLRSIRVRFTGSQSSSNACAYSEG